MITFPDDVDGPFPEELVKMNNNTMTVQDVFEIKGRGIVAVVNPESVPIGGLKLGILLHQGDRAWKVVGAEMPGKSNLVGLVLNPLGHDERPVVGTIEL